MLLLRQISNTSRGEKKEASCLFPSLTLWNSEEGGKNPPKRRFKKERRKKETNDSPINTPYLEMRSFFLSSLPLSCLPLLSLTIFVKFIQTFFQF